jgi:hypothetical protein
VVNVKRGNPDSHPLPVRSAMNVEVLSHGLLSIIKNLNHINGKKNGRFLEENLERSVVVNVVSKRNP